MLENKAKPFHISLRDPIATISVNKLTSEQGVAAQDGENRDRNDIPRDIRINHLKTILYNGNVTL